MAWDVDNVDICECGKAYDRSQYSSCYECFLERRSNFATCIYCGRWHSPRFDTCYQCRQQAPERQEAAKELRAYIMWRDDFRCRRCQSIQDLQIDHIKPCAKGGDATPWNLQVLCKRCNALKSDSYSHGDESQQFRRLLIGYYFLAGRSWLDDEQMATLREDVAALRGGR